MLTLLTFPYGNAHAWCLAYRLAGPSSLQTTSVPALSASEPVLSPIEPTPFDRFALPHQLRSHRDRFQTSSIRAQTGSKPTLFEHYPAPYQFRSRSIRRQTNSVRPPSASKPALIAPDPCPQAWSFFFYGLSFQFARRRKTKRSFSSFQFATCSWGTRVTPRCRAYFHPSTVFRKCFATTSQKSSGQLCLK